MPVEIILDDGGSVADHCRRLGLSVGDTIFGREEGPRGRWHEARLTLLWVGQQEAMWLEQTRTDDAPEWTDPEESGDWCLDCRPWKKVETTSGVAPVEAQSSALLWFLRVRQSTGDWGKWQEIDAGTVEDFRKHVTTPALYEVQQFAPAPGVAPVEASSVTDEQLHHIWTHEAGAGVSWKDMLSIRDAICRVAASGVKTVDGSQTQ